MYDEDPASNPLSAPVDSNAASDGSNARNEDDLSASVPAKPKAETYPVYKIIPADPNAPKPEIKRYAHHGKRRRSITEDLFRCTFVTKVISDELTCGALLWKNRPQELRAHLLSHLTLDTVTALSDEQVLQSYTDAKRIFLASIPDDEVYGLNEEDLDEEDDLDIEEEQIDNE